ncbi:MAG: PLP-dependent transferase, partial [Syntrophorhabdus sp.]
MDYKTKILHNGNDLDPFTGASSIPVYQASTFSQADPMKFGPYVYARGMNPTREALENTIALLEGGEIGCAFASGVAAISSVFLLFKPGDHVVVAED